MDKVINEIINTINSSNWSKNKKIRYAYLELGKNIHKNVEFFYTLFNKLKTSKYTAEKIKEIYTNELATDSVICRDVAVMLKKIFDACGIESEIRRFCKVQEYIVDDEKMFIQHYIISVKGDNEKKYFLTLVPDIPNIQLGFRTEHFGNNIEYLDKFNNPIYEGEEIEHTIMTFEELKQIDEELGFLSLKFQKDSFDYMDEALIELGKVVNFKNVQPLIRTESNEFYMGLIRLLNLASMNSDEDSLSCDLSKIKSNDWKSIEYYILDNIVNFIQNKYNLKFDNYQSIISLVNNEKYDELFLLFKANVSMLQDESSDFYNINAVIYNLCNMLKTISLLDKTVDYKSEEFIKLKRRFNELIDKLCILFVDKSYVYVDDKCFTNGYIINKLKKYMPLIFDFGNTTKFSTMEIGEKVVVLDKILRLLLDELKNDKLIPRNQSDFLDNRTYRTVIKDVETGKYLYLIVIHAAGDYGTKVLIYDFDLNTIKGFDENVSFFELISSGKYEILSDQIYIEVEKMEKYRRDKSTR